MAKLLRNLSFLLATVGLTYCTIIIGGNSGSTTGYNSYIASIIDKQKRLETTPSPKIVFIGGSNLVMGLDSPGVEQALGMPVANMGVNAGFGLRFMLNQVKPFVRQGDIIVIVPEYEQFYGHLNGSTTLIEVLTIFPQGILYLDSPDQYTMIASEFPVFAQGMLNSFFSRFQKHEGFYATRQSFNDYGDIVAHLDVPSPVNVADLTLLASDENIFDERALQVLTRFAVDAKSVGARVFVIFPAVPDQQFKENKAQIETMNERLGQESALVVLGKPSDYVFPPSYFFDTVYHLNRQGRDVRTQKIIDTLSQVVP